MSSHDRLKALGITPTIDAERAYEAGKADADETLRDELHDAQECLERFGRALVEIHLITQRTR